jgi:hypothetical protein
VSIRQRLYPHPGQLAGVVEHCHHARFVFNIGLEQRAMWRRDKHNRGTHPERGNLDAARVNTTTQCHEVAFVPTFRVPAHDGFWEPRGTSTSMPQILTDGIAVQTRFRRASSRYFNP